MTTSAAPDIPIRHRARTLLTAAVIILLAVVVYFVLPDDMNELAKRSTAVFVIAALFWATELLPLFATSLCVIGIEILLLAHHGGLAPQGAAPGGADLSAAVFLAPFSSGVIILFMGGFLLSASVSKHGLDRAIGAHLVRPFARGPKSTIAAILVVTAFFSMWMSNTATTAMMLAILAPIVRDLPAGDRFRQGMILAVPVGANLGGLGTPIGTPPNAVAYAALRQAGYEIAFLDWMYMAVPLLSIMLLLGWGVLLLMFRPTGNETIDFASRPVAHAKITGAGKTTLIILLCAIVLWITSKWHGVSDAVVALIAAASLAALRVLDREDVDSIDWNILILMWGGLSLGVAMQETGLVDYIVAMHFAGQSGLLLAAGVVLLAMGLSTFMSNTAAANLLIPLALGISATEGSSLMVLVALSTSMAMAMPISTPPNAMAFSTGEITSKSLMKVGIPLGVAAIVILLAGYRIVLPLTLG